MKLRLGITISLLTIANFGSASPYRTEVTGGFQEFQSDFYPDIHIRSISANWYFEEVDTGSHPLAEAAFLERKSSINLEFSNVDSLTGVVGVDPETGVSSFWQELHTHHFLSGSIDYYVPNTILYLGATYKYNRLGSDQDHFSNTWGAIVGVTPLEGLLISTEYWEKAGYTANIQAQYVKPLAGENAIRLEGSYYDGDGDEDTLEVGADFYFDRSWSAGVVAVDYSDTSVGLRTRKFFTESLSVAVEYFDIERLYKYQLSASFRF